MIQKIIQRGMARARSFARLALWPTPFFPDAFRWLVALLGLLCATFGTRLEAQITDDFSSGNLNAWQGDVANFTVNAAGRLQLNAPAAGTSGIWVGGNIPDSAVWNLYVRLEFAPSVTNLLRLYLMSDAADPLNCNGYYLEIGENGNNDPIKLFRQTGSVRTQLAAGPPAFVALEPVDLRIRARRSSAGEWVVEARPEGGAWIPQFTTADATHAGGPDRFLGIQCIYTATRVDKFFFDDLSVLPDLPDAQPPSALSVALDGPDKLIVTFDEDMEAASAENGANYVLSPGSNPVVSAELLPDAERVRLTFGAPFVTAAYALTISGVKDLAGNEMGPQTLNFDYQLIESAGEFDILINEIMFDPTPSAGLPEVEWVEFFNRSDKYINLGALLFSDDGTPRPLPNRVLGPGEYAVVCAAGAALSALQTAVPDALGMVGWPTLNNDADDLRLTDENGQLIDRVFYRVSWHDDAAKSEGGWTLERINPNTPCLDAENWRSCPILPGGTPGQLNASLDASPDATAPQLLEAFPVSATQLRLRFSEGLDIATVGDVAAYALAPPMPVLSAAASPDAREIVLLELGAALQGSIAYTLTVSAAVQDCGGNGVLQQQGLAFGLPEAVAEYDVLINEIMSDPMPSAGLPEEEWLEIYNRSNKFIAASSLFLSKANTTPRALPDRVLAPGDYMVICATGSLTALQSAVPEALAMTGFPPLTNSSDDLRLTTASGALIDRVAYLAAWHESNAKADGGWSLERINPNTPCLGAENWRSCPVLPGGTPGKPNASLSNQPDLTAPVLTDVYPLSATQLRLRFSEVMDKGAAMESDLYQIEPPLPVLSSALDPIERDIAYLELGAPMQAGVVYGLKALPDLSDCSGSVVTDRAPVLFGFPEQPQPGDLIINEVLFNPSLGGSRFVELYNNSARIVSWENLFLANFSANTPVRPVGLQKLILPGEYQVLTPSPEDIQSRFADVIPERLIRQTFPSMSTENGNVTVYWSRDGQTVTLDSFEYTGDYHNRLFSKSQQRGVSLERVRADEQTNLAVNWASAAVLGGGAAGTPTRPNSQSLPDIAIPEAESWIRIPNARFSPNQDGFEDFLEIYYETPAPGYAAAITIYDAGGAVVKRLARQELVGTSGVIRWDGDTDGGLRVRTGIHVAYAEFFNAGGEVRRFKKTFAVVLF